MFKLSFNGLLGKERDNPEEAIFREIEGYNDIKKLRQCYCRFYDSCLYI